MQMGVKSFSHALVSKVGRSERSHLRHVNPNEILCVGGRYARSDMGT